MLANEWIEEGNLTEKEIQERLEAIGVTDQTVKENLLSLAQIYAKKADYINASALYNFALAMVHKEQKKGIVSDNARLQAEAMEIEERLSEVQWEFLSRLGDNSVLSDKEEWKKRIFHRNKNNKEAIAAIREKSKIAMQEYQPYSVTKAPYISENAEYQEEPEQAVTVENIYKENNIALRAFIGEVIIHAQEDLKDSSIESFIGKDDYAIICFGSLAREEATPYSDVEFGILLDESINERSDAEIENIKAYFRILSDYVNINIINLGETTTAIQNIDSLKHIQIPIESGLSFDGRAKGACKFPAGNMHHKQLDIANIENSLDLTKQEKDRQIAAILADTYGYYELIATPSQMAQFHQLKWHKEHPHLTTVLSNLQLLEGNVGIVQDYIKEKNKRLSERIFVQNLHPDAHLYEVFKKLGIHRDVMPNFDEKNPLKERTQITVRDAILADLIQEALSKFEPRAGRDQASGRTFSSKYDFYRMPSLFIDCFSYKYGIEEGSIWDKFDALFVTSQENPNPPLAISNQVVIANLKWMISRVLQIRLDSYQEKGAQDEDVMTLGHAMESEEIDVMKKDFNIKKEEIFEIYYVMLDFYVAMKGFQEEKADNNFPFMHRKLWDGYIFSLLHDYGNAITHFESAMLYHEQSEENAFSYVEIAKISNNLAMIYQQNGDDEPAISYYQRSLEELHKDKDSDAVLIGMILGNIAFSKNNLGLFHEDQKSHQKARALYEDSKRHYIDALRIFVENSEKNLILIAQTLNNLGLLYINMKENDAALLAFKTVLAIDQELLDKDNPHIANALNNVALIYNRKGKHKEAIEYYKKDLQISVRKLGTEHLDVATTLNNIGTSYFELGECDEAVQYLEKALKIRQAKLHKTHPKVITILENIGAAFLKKEDYVKASHYFCVIWEECDAVKKAEFGKILLPIAATMNNEGAKSFTRKHFSKAVKHLEQALKIRQQILPKGSKEIETTLQNLALVYINTKEHLKATDAFLQLFQGDYVKINHSIEGVKQNYVTHYGKDHPETIAMSNYLDYLKEIKQLTEYKIPCLGSTEENILKNLANKYGSSMAKETIGSESYFNVKLPSSILKKDLREALGLDRLLIGKVKVEEKEFLINHIPNIIFEQYSANPSKTLITFPFADDNRSIIEVALNDTKRAAYVALEESQEEKPSAKILLSECHKFVLEKRSSPSVI